MHLFQCLLLTSSLICTGSSVIYQVSRYVWVYTGSLYSVVLVYLSNSANSTLSYRILVSFDFWQDKSPTLLQELIIFLSTKEFLSFTLNRYKIKHYIKELIFKYSTKSKQLDNQSGDIQDVEATLAKVAFLIWIIQVFPLPQVNRCCFLSARHI